MSSGEDKGYIDSAISIFLSTSVFFKVGYEEFYLFEMKD